MLKCARCGKSIMKGEEYREGELYEQHTPESEQIGHYQLCMPCFSDIECEVIGF